MPTLADPDPSLGAVIDLRTLGDFLIFNPHSHVLCTDGVFWGSGWFKVAPTLDTAELEEIFQLKVVGMLLQKGKITKNWARVVQ
jgi:hypothetical protein